MWKRMRCWPPELKRFRHVGSTRAGSSARTNLRRELGGIQSRKSSFSDFNIAAVRRHDGARDRPRIPPPKSPSSSFRHARRGIRPSAAAQRRHRLCPEDETWCGLPPRSSARWPKRNARAQRRRGEELLALEHTVVLELADADSASAGLKAVIRSICETEGWDLGRYFRGGRESRAGCASRTPGACPSRALEEFVEGSREMTFAPEVG